MSVDPRIRKVNETLLEIIPESSIIYKDGGVNETLEIITPNKTVVLKACGNKIDGGFFMVADICMIVEGECLLPHEAEEVKNPYSRRPHEWNDFSDEHKAMYRELWKGRSDEEIIDQINKPVMTKEEANELMEGISSDFDSMKRLRKGDEVDFNYSKLLADVDDVCCDRYKKGMKEIVDQNVYCYEQYDAPQYNGGSFKFCPWCGEEL